MNTHELKNKEQPHEFWNPAPDGSVPVWSCLHNNTHSPMLTEMNLASRFQMISAPRELKLFAYFRKNGRTKCWHKVPSLLHQKHKHFASPVRPWCWYAFVFVCIDLWEACKPSVCRSRSNPCCQHRRDFLDGQSNLPDWLSLSVSHSEADHQSNGMHTYKEINWASEKPNYLQVNCKTFILGELPLRMDWRTVAWACDCSTAVVYFLKCETLIRPRIPWWDSLITCHWDLCKWWSCHYNFY